MVTLLCRLTRANAEVGSAQGAEAGEAFDALMRQCGSGLERRWLGTVRAGGYRLPDRAQPLLTEFSTQPDFAYEHVKALVYIDGPHHRDLPTKMMDDVRRQALRDAGYKVIVFTEDQGGWSTIFSRFPFVFGNGKP